MICNEAIRRRIIREVDKGSVGSGLIRKGLVRRVGARTGKGNKFNKLEGLFHHGDQGAASFKRAFMSAEAWGS